MKITVFGTGYVGLVTGACLADAGHDVLCVDVDPAKVEALERGVVPIFEPGLEALVARNREEGRLVGTAMESHGWREHGIYAAIREAIQSKGHQLAEDE